MQHEIYEKASIDSLNFPLIQSKKVLAVAFPGFTDIWALTPHIDTAEKDAILKYTKECQVFFCEDYTFVWIHYD